MKKALKPFLQLELNNIEIAGLTHLFNKFYKDYLETKGIYNAKYEGFFYCDGFLQSESEANGLPLKFENYNISHLMKRIEGDLTYMILEGKQGSDGKQYVCEFNDNSGQWYILGTKKSGNIYK